MQNIIDAYRAGMYKKQYWLPNIISGIIVGIVALPLAMAFAIASGAKPEQGLYTAIVAGFLVSTFGGSRVQIAGPTGAFIVVLSGITIQYGIDGLQIATLLAGGMLFLMGILRLGGVIKFIPYPVIIGFTAGIAVVIFVGQWQYFFGLPTPHGAHFHEKLWALIHTLPTFNANTTYLGCTALLIVIFTNRIPWLKRVPSPMVALTILTALQAYFHFDGVATIGSAFGGIPQELAKFQLPKLSLDRVLELIGPAFTIAMLGAIESLLSAVVADGMAGTRHNSNRELIGQGIANIFAPLFGGFAATGAIARTATNIRNGGSSPLSGIVHSITLVLIILCLAPLAVDVPLAVLAAILFVVAWNMSEAKRAFTIIRKAPIADITILLVTFFLTIFVDLVVAVNIGVILAILHFLRIMAASVTIEQYQHKHLPIALQHTNIPEIPHDVVTYTIEGPFFFAAIDSFQHALETTHTDPRVLILYLKFVPFIDIAGLNALEETIKDLQHRHIRVILCGAKPQITVKLSKAGLLKLVGTDNVFQDMTTALAAVHL